MAQDDLDLFIDSIRRTVEVSYLNRSHTQLTVRCFECGDSKKNPYHAHLNIRLADPEHLVWRCPRCEAAGVVNSDFLRGLQVYDNYAMEFGHRNAMRVRKLRRKITGRRGNTLRTIINPIETHRNAQDKVAYCNDRLGIDLSVEDWVREYKLVVDFRSLFAANPWMVMTEDKRKMAQLSDEGVGFISSDNSTIIFRDIYGDWEKRYFNYNVYEIPLPDNSTAYAPASAVHLLEERVTLIMTEGIFDIIGVREHCDPPLKEGEDDYPKIYMANNGKSYMPTVNRVAKLGYVEQDIMIYSDSDVPLHKFKTMREYNPVMRINPMSIYYNTASKDCGVPKNKITLRCCRVI